MLLVWLGNVRFPADLSVDSSEEIREPGGEAAIRGFGPPGVPTRGAPMPGRVSGGACPRQGPTGIRPGPAPGAVNADGPDRHHYYSGYVTHRLRVDPESRDATHEH